MRHLVEMEKIASYLPKDSEYILRNQNLDAGGLVEQAIIALHVAIKTGDDSLLLEIEELESLFLDIPDGEESTIFRMIRGLIDGGKIIIDEKDGIFTVKEALLTKNDGDKVSLLPQKPHKKPDEKRKRTLRQIGKRRARKEDKENKYIPGRIKISNVPEMESVVHKKEVVHIHFCGQDGMNHESIAQMIRLFPNVVLVTAAQTLFNKFFWPGNERRALLDKNNIQCQLGYWSNPEMYKKTRLTPQLEERKKLYREIFINRNNEEVRNRLLNMQRLGVLDLDLLHYYLAGNPTSMTKISGQLGLGHGYVSLTITTLLLLMGEEFDSLKTHSNANGKLTKYYKYIRAEGEHKAWLDLQREHSVEVVHEGDGEETTVVTVYPPKNLPLGKWYQWQQLTILSSGENQEEWKQLENNKPYIAETLKRYFQLGEFSGSKVTHGKISQTVPGISGDHVSMERVRQWIQEGLDYLGIKN